MRNKKRFIKYLLTVIVIGIILYITIFNRQRSHIRIFKPLFWELKNGFWEDIGLNILLFVPFGAIIGNRKGIAAGFFLSIGIEVTQYIFCLGYCEMDDVLHNTLGCLIGYSIYVSINYLKKK